MKTYKIDDFKLGWFVGDFSPAIINSPFVEVAYHTHKVGDKPVSHYHKLATEITVVVEGSLKINNKTFHEGDIFVIEPFEVSEAEILADCKLIVVKSPSIPKDKYICES